MGNPRSCILREGNSLIMRTYRNKKSGAVVLVQSEVKSEEWEEILAPLSSVSDAEDAKPEKVEEKPKRKTASKKKK